MNAAGLAALVKERAAGKDRFILGIAGPPGSGKSTLAADLARTIGPGARVVPMDGFHLDNAVLAARGRLARKGAPDTFDVAGLLHLLARLRSGEDGIAIPLFDRSLEISRAGAEVVTLRDRILIVEGNYLLLDEEPWPQVAARLDLTVYLAVSSEELVRRLHERWASCGKSPDDARVWIETNDLPNINRVISRSRHADLVM
jgi:pantothenate kinase